MQRRNRRKRNIDPKTLKKHSAILSEQTGNDVVVLGFKEETKTGYMIPGHAGNKFVTFFEVMLPGSASGMCMHPEKERTIRVLAGQGFVLLKGEEDVETQIPIAPGDEVAFKTGVSYRLSTTSLVPLELFVVQDKRYGDGLVVVEKSTTPVEAALLDLTPNVREETVTTQRGPTKARVHQAVSRGQAIQAVEQREARKPKGVQDGMVIGASPKPGGPNQFGNEGAG